MTKQEQSIADDKMRAEIGKLMADTAKVNKETKWYEAVILAGGASAITLAIVAVTKLFF